MSKALQKNEKEKAEKKVNESCIKLFEFIKMLYKGDVDFKTVINHFSEGNYDGTSNTHVTLNKYLNAMKIFGLKIKKSKHKYSLQNSIYKLDLTLDDIKSVEILKDAVQLMNDGKNKTDLENFIKVIEMRYDDYAQNIVELLNDTKNYNLLFAKSEMLEQLKQIEQYCKENQKLEIIFTTVKGEEINLICSPLQPIYEKKEIGLRALGNNGTRIYDIPCDSIKSIKQLPLTSSRQAIPTTVVYKIKNRLAKNYKLREWEKCETIQHDGSQVIVNKNEDLDLLIKRLMRYGKECEILSPKFFKEEMISVINETLSKYE